MSNFKWSQYNRNHGKALSVILVDRLDRCNINKKELARLIKVYRKNKERYKLLNMSFGQPHNQKLYKVNPTPLYLNLTWYYGLVDYYDNKDMQYHLAVLEDKYVATDVHFKNNAFWVMLMGLTMKREDVMDKVYEFGYLIDYVYTHRKEFDRSTISEILTMYKILTKIDR